MPHYRSQKVYMPSCGGSMSSRHTRGKMGGCGVGAVLLDGGMGGRSSAGSYSSVSDYASTTGVNPYSGRKTGMGLANSDMLRNIQIKPFKRPPSKAIKFSL